MTKAVTPQIARPTSEERLRELASKAIPGPWYLRDAMTDEESGVAGGWPADVVVPAEDGGAVSLLDICTERDCAYIAACSPDAILALLDRLDQLRESERQRDSAEYQLDRYKRVTSYILDPNIKRLDRDVLRRLAESALDSDTPATEPER